MAGSVGYEIEHVSRYDYTAPASACVMRLCLKPRGDGGQRLLRFAVATDPPAACNPETDAFGNTRHVLNLHREHSALAITAASAVRVEPKPPVPDALHPDAWAAIRAAHRDFADWDLIRPSVLTNPSPILTDFMRRLDIRPDGDPLTSLRRLSDTLYHAFTYSPGSTTAVSPIEHVLQSGRGVCQDYAHVMLAIARAWGIPSRYVSGYLHVAGTDAGQAPGTATHAWVECRLPGLDWIGFDPTNRTLADQRYVRLAVGRDYQDVAPTRGVFRGGGDSRLQVTVHMRPLPAAPA